MSHFPIDPARLQSGAAPLLFAATLLQEQPRVTAPHRHARGQLFGAACGLLSVQVEGAQWVVPPSHAVWIPPHQLHALRSHGALQGWSVYIAEAGCADLPRAPCTMRTSGLLREAVARASSWGHAALDAAQARVAAVIADEILGLPREAFGLPMPTDARLLRIALALMAELDSPRRLEEWAAWAGLAPRTLTRRLLAETGFTFAAWRQRARILRALEMLAADLPVTTIALELGYDNISAFIAMFKRVCGTTPGRYLSSPQ